MTAYAITSIRLALVLTFLIGMPVLALPQVAHWCEAQLYAPKAKRRILAARVLPTTAPTVVPAAAIGDRTPLPWISQAAHEQSIDEPSAVVAQENAPNLGALAAEVQSLGATFYRLEQLQSQPDRYQFTTQVAREANVPQRGQVSAIAATPAEAMQQVIDQIRAGR